jgi:hypothetical protein
MVPFRLLVIPALFLCLAASGFSAPPELPVWTVDLAYGFSSGLPYYYSQEIMTLYDNSLFEGEKDIRYLDEYTASLRLDLGGFSVLASLPLRNVVVFAELYTLQGFEQARLSEMGPGGATLAAEQRIALPFGLETAVRAGADIPNTNGTNGYWDGRNPCDAGLDEWILLRQVWDFAGWNRLEGECKVTQPGKRPYDMDYDSQNNYRYGLRERFALLETFRVPLPWDGSLSLFGGICRDNQLPILLVTNSSPVADTASSVFRLAAGADFTVFGCLTAGFSVWSAAYSYLTNTDPAWGFSVHSSFTFGGSGSNIVSRDMDAGLFGPDY